MGRMIEVEDHLGNKFDSITSMCKHYEISNRLYSSRISRGFTIEQALGLKEKKRRGYTAEELMNVYSLTEKQFEVGKNLGLSAYETRELIDGKLYLDPQLNVYKSFNAMCKSWGKNASTVRNRLKKGYTLEEALRK